LKTATTHKNFPIVLKSYKDYALEVIPVEDIHERALELDPVFQHGLVKALLEWYKTKFFTWVNTLECVRCKKVTENLGMGQPTAEDTRVGASRVELHKCPTCGAIYRFPRIKYC
jgi:peptide-N4-(N-acetyl-beta-glucosaminyl)asparagine amidase